jgi:MFS family permease
VWPFSRLLTSYTVNELGDAVGLVALAVLVFDRTEAVAPTAAFFIIAKFLPALLAPALTARLDQYALRRTLPALYVLEAAAFGALALIADGNFVLALVLILGLVDGAIAITARGLTRGAVATVLQPAGMLKEGNALMNVGFALASVFGAALGGLLIGTLGLATALLVDAASFLVIAILLACTSGLPEARVEREPWMQRLRSGLRFVGATSGVKLLLIGQAVALVFFTIVVPIEVIYAKESLGTTSTGFGILLSSWGAGIVVGSIVYVAVKQRSTAALVIVSTLAVGLAYVGLAAAQTLLVACLISIIGGAGNGVQWIAVMTALQEATPSDYQARITGLLESLGAAMPGVGFLLGGLITALGSPRTAFAVAGGGVVMLVIIGSVLRSRELRRAPARGISYGPDRPPEEIPLAPPLESAGGQR